MKSVPRTPDAQGDQSLQIPHEARDPRVLAEAVVELAGDGLWDWDIRTGYVTFSPRWFRNLGYEPGELEPHIHTWEQLVHPEDMLRVKEALALHFEGKTPIYECTNRLRMKSGEYRWNVDRGKVVERSADGSPARMIGFDIDVSAQWTAEEQMSETLSALRSLYEITTRTEPRFDAQIRAMLEMGCQRFGLLSGVLARVDGDRYEIVKAVGLPAPFEEGHVLSLGDTFCRETLQVGGPLVLERGTQSEAPCDPAHRTLRLASYMGIPVRVGKTVYGTLSFSSPRAPNVRPKPSDEPILKLMAQWVGGELGRLELRKKLMERERLAAVGTTAATLAHEISNPLNGMLLNAHRLRRHLERVYGDQDEETTAVMGALLREFKRLSQLLEEFRSWSRRPTLSSDPVELGALLDHLVRVLRPELVGVGVRLEEDLGDGSARVIGDAGKLEQVFLNLCRNAAEAMPEGGALSLVVRCTGKEVVTEIRDTGVGIPEGMDVFEAFQTTKAQGTGLGLAVAKQVIEAHGGQIWFERLPRSGTAFFVRLPRHVPAPQAARD